MIDRQIGTVSARTVQSRTPLELLVQCGKPGRIRRSTDSKTGDAASGWFTMTTRPTRRRLGATVVLVVALLLAAATVFILIVPVADSDFEAATGVEWHSFSSANPAVATYLMREARLLAVGYLGLTLLVATESWQLLRRDETWPNKTLWLFLVTLWGAALVFFTGGGAGLGFMYLAAGLIAALGLVAGISGSSGASR